MAVMLIHIPNRMVKFREYINVYVIPRVMEEKRVEEREKKENL